MKKLLVILALCMVLSVVLVACEDPATGTEDTTAGTTAPEVTTPEETTPEETTPEETTPEETTPEETTPEETTPEETTPEETTPPADPVKVGMSFDQLYTGNGPATAGEENFFTPGQSASWDGIAIIEDYNVQYVTVWGWVAFFAETPATFGYQIGDAEPVFSADFYVEPEQPVIDAALGSGGKSAGRMHISIPVEYVSGEGIVVKALAKDAAGTVETLVEFALTKPVNPNAPVAFVPAADMAASIPGSPGITSATMSADGNYITIDTMASSDPYYQLPMLNAKGLVATHVAIKYRTTSTSYTTSEMFVGSGGGPSGQGDNIRFELTCDGKWHLAIVDLSQASAVVDGVVNYLRWDPFAGGSDAPIDMAYIALFNSAEAAVAYDAQFADIYRDVPAHSDVKVDLGVRTSGGPFVGSEKKFGQKLPLGETFLKNVTVSAMATYSDGNVNTWSFKVWQWAGDYATTVAGTPLYVVNGENHNDNQDFSVDVPAKLLISGDVYYEIEYLSGSAQFTGWTADAILVEGVESYVDGNLKEGTYASSVVVGVELPPVEKPEFGSLELPLTVTETLDAVAGLEEGSATENQYYTTGVVTEIGQTGSYYKNVYFTDGENTMLIYTLNPMDGMPELQVGDTITVFGYIKNYGGTIEFASKYVDDAQVYVYIVAHEPAPVEEAPVYEGNWHASVDSFMYCVNGDFSDVVDFTAAATNKTNGTTITSAAGTLSSVTANYVYLANGWLAVDGYSLENWACDIIAADGTVLKTVDLALREAEEGVVTHVANYMGYAGVPNRIGANNAEIISLGEYTGQTVKVVYRVGAGEYTINLIELEVIVP